MFNPGLYFLNLDLTKTKVLPGSRKFCDSGLELNVQINQKAKFATKHLRKIILLKEIIFEKDFFGQIFDIPFRKFSFKTVISISDLSGCRGRYDHALYYISPNLSRKGRYMSKMVHRTFGQKKIAFQIFCLSIKWFFWKGSSKIFPFFFGKSKYALRYMEWFVAACTFVAMLYLFMIFWHLAIKWICPALWCNSKTLGQRNMFHYGPISSRVATLLRWIN